MTSERQTFESAWTEYHDYIKASANNYYNDGANIDVAYQKARADAGEVFRSDDEPFPVSGERPKGPPPVLASDLRGIGMKLAAFILRMHCCDAEAIPALVQDEGMRLVQAFKKVARVH
jgi:hypothetical protein